MSRVAGAAGPTDLGALANITPLVLTFNEAPNLARCLDRLTWASRVVVLDSQSEDETVQIAGRYPNVEVHTRAFDDHTSQWNHGLSLIRTSWVLSLDADYVVPAAFQAEAGPIVVDDEVDAACAGFRYVVLGRPLRASLYPPRAVLFRPDRCRYEPDGHTQRLLVTGRSVKLPTPFDHDDRKPLSRWLASQGRYASLEAEHLLSRRSLPFQDRLRRTVVFAPPVVLFYTLIVRGAALDGWAGWYYALQRTTAEVLLSLHLLDRKLRGRAQ